MAAPLAPPARVQPGLTSDPSEQASRAPPAMLGEASGDGFYRVILAGVQGSWLWRPRSAGGGSRDRRTLKGQEIYRHVDTGV